MTRADITVDVPAIVQAKAAAATGGKEWLRDLPSLLGDLERAWSMTLTTVLPGGTASLVARALTDDGRHAVLKVAVPGSGFTQQVRTLTAAHIDIKAVKMALYGFLVSAPLSHFLVSQLQKAFAGKTSGAAKLGQILANNLIVAPIQTAGTWWRCRVISPHFRSTDAPCYPASLLRFWLNPGPRNQFPSSTTLLHLAIGCRLCRR